MFCSLPKGSSLGFRTEVQAVAEQRKHEIARFLDSLFTRNISISQSDLVYTFFHPLLRDQQEADIHLRKLRGEFKRWKFWAMVIFGAKGQFIETPTLEKFWEIMAEVIFLC